jgi:DNA polymerase III subunit gamma/tau
MTGPPQPSSRVGAPAPDGPDEPFVSLYRRFRPGRFAELRGQPHVVLALRSAVRDGHVAHAYLFSGPRGTGKTSTARILARALNCADPDEGEPCGRCPSCVDIARGTSLDVHELDAASNNGVDAMRDLVTHAALGTPGRWKVYIVDEVHMLSNAAANALLKTLEEPPAHVVFVLATTDPQKVPPTIRSRTQHFEFRLLGAETLTGLLRDVRDAAALDLADEDLSAAVRRGRGSARDALSALDQVAAAGSADDARPGLDDVVEGLCADDAGRTLVALAALHEAGWGPQQLAGELVDLLRQAFLVAMAPELADVSGAELDQLAATVERMSLARLVRAMEALGRAQVDMRDAPDARVVLEVTLVRLSRPDLDDDVSALVDRIDRLERQVAAASRPPGGGRSDRPDDLVAEREGVAGDPMTRPSLGALRRQRPVESAPAPPATPLPSPSAEGRPTSASAGPLPDRDTIVQAWGDHILRSLPARAKALYSAGRFVEVRDGAAVFALPKQAHCDRCEDVRPLVEEAVAAHLGVRVPLRLVVEAEAAPSGRPPLAPSTGERAEGRGSPPSEDEEDFDEVVFDDSPAAAEAVESVAQARLLEAFPGAQEVPD